METLQPKIHLITPPRLLNKRLHTMLNPPRRRGIVPGALEPPPRRLGGMAALRDVVERVLDAPGMLQTQAVAAVDRGDGRRAGFGG